ncbi:hypothetical protein RvY_06413 [Ramazzottius varieornatus]|uniref:Uncharacterized protein n=1 Tax=Ramazzottius varieornatus TaxID=947166 RepID=A0A1D1V847_RAMVA|nr:hypothetical protein RvY_06413 [Ramazzottius varieornatus]
MAGMTEQKAEISYDSSNVSDNGAPSAPDYPPPEYYIDVPKGFFGKGMRIAICHYNPDFPGGKNSRSVGHTLNHPAPLPVKASAPPTCWPHDNFVLYKPKSGCPDGWSEGSVHHTLLPNSRIAPSLDSALVEDGVISNYCAHEEQYHQMGKGSYCIAEGTIKEGGIIDKSCPEGFEYNWFIIEDIATNNRNEMNE